MSWPPPPPTRQPPPNTSGALDDLLNQDKDAMKNSKMNDIDGDDESTEISDTDSILAMAKRLEEASVISDPSFIEGTAPHLGGVEPGGRRTGPGGLYAQQRDLDSIASESEDDGSSSSSSGSSSSDSSFERNPNRGQRPMGQPHVGFHDSDRDRDYRPNSSYPQQPMNQGYPQQSYRGGPPPGYNTSGYSQDRARYDNYNGAPPEYDNKNVRFSERGRVPVYRYEDLEATPASKIREDSTSRSRERSRSRSPSRNSAKLREEEEKRERKRKMKLIVLPIVILLAIGAAVGVAITVGKQGGDDENAASNPDAPKFEIAVPTASPTFIGLYNCIGKSGPTPTKGCIGYVQCNGVGDALGDVIMCPSGTLYDVRSNICNHADQVQCATRMPTPEELDTLNEAPGLTPRPTPRPTLATFDVTPQPPKMGPITTYEHRLAFIGISTPGNMALFEQNLENYLMLFYSPANLAALPEDDELRSLSEVQIEVNVVTLERRRLHDGSDDMIRQSIPEKRLLRVLLDEQRLLQTENFVAVYDQTTTYRTTDPSVSIGTIVRRPFDSEYTATLIEHLIRRDPNTFGTLTDIFFVEGNEPLPGTTTPGPTDAATAYEPSKPPTKRPIETEAPTPFLSDGTKSPTKQPANPLVSPAPSAFQLAFPSLSTIQGLLWLDEDGDGLFSTNEAPMEGTFVNLRECEGDRWKATASANAIGQYQFVGVEAGRYYVDFFKPAPADRYDFTRPKVGGDNDLVLDSEVVKLVGANGQSDCMDVGKDFKTLINAGYRLKATPDPTPDPTPEPTKEPTPEPTPSPMAAKPLTTKSPTVPKFCAEVLAADDFDFRGCTLPCQSLNHEDCPEGMLCAFTQDC